MSDHRLNWHLMEKFFPRTPIEKNTFLYLSANKSLVFGQSLSDQIDLPREALPAGDMSLAWKEASEVHKAQGMAVVNREELIRQIKECVTIHRNEGATDSFHTQLNSLKERWMSNRSPRSAWITKRGAADEIWAQNHFFLDLFQGFLADFLPKRKFVVVGLVNESDEMESLVLEFSATKLVGVHNVDFSGLELPVNKMQPAVARLLNANVQKNFSANSYCFLTRKAIWQECSSLQKEHSTAAAWRFLLQSTKKIGAAQDVLIEPLPFLLRWSLGWKKYTG